MIKRAVHFNIATLALMATMAVNSIADGAVVYCQQIKSWFTVERSSSLTPDGITAVASTADPTVTFARLPIAHPSNLIVNDWYIDPVSGSDTNDGLSAGTALQTHAELARRWSGGYIKPSTFGQSGTFITYYCTVHVLGTTPDTDPAFPNCRLPLNTILWYKGGASGSAAYTGTIGSVIAKNTATNTAYALVDSSLTPASFLGKRWRIPSGTRQGMTGWIEKDLGSNTARTTENGTIGPLNPAYSSYGPLVYSSFSATTAVAADPYVIENLITITIGRSTSIDLDIGSANSTTFSTSRVVWGELSIRNSLVINSAGVSFYSCDFQLSVTSNMLGSTTFIGCHFGFGLRINSGFATVGACGFDNVSSTSAFGLECFPMGSVTLQSGTLFQNVGIHGSNIIINDCAVFDSAATGANASLGHGISIGQTQVSTLWARHIGWAFFLGAFWGSGNAGYGVHLNAGCKAQMNNSNIIPTCTGASGDFSMNTTTQCRAWDDTAGAYTAKRNSTWALFNTSVAGGGFAQLPKDPMSGTEWVKYP